MDLTGPSNMKINLNLVERYSLSFTELINFKNVVTHGLEGENFFKKRIFFKRHKNIKVLIAI